MRNIAFDIGLDAPLRATLCNALHAVVGPEPTARQRDLLALAGEVLGPPADGGFDPVDLAAFRGHALAEHAVVALIVAACVDRSDSADPALAVVQSCAHHAGAGEQWVSIARQATRGWGTLATARLALRVPDGRHMLAQTWSKDGMAGLVAVLGSPLGWSPSDAVRARRFQDMRALPADTVGHTFVHTLTEVGIPLPGQSGGLTDGALHHDLMHVLTGYDTTPAGECQLGGLYAGFGYEGWPAWTVVTLLTFELGLRVGPTFTPPTVGAFDVRAVWAAALRAGTARFHPLDPNWDIDRLWTMQLERAREVLGLGSHVSSRAAK